LVFLYCTLVQSPKPAIPEVQKVLVEFLGPLPRGSLPMQAESRILGMSRYKVNTYTNDLAALVFYFTRHFVTSIISSLLFKVEMGCIELIASFRFYMHDETTFVTRVLRFCKEKPTATPEDIAAESTNLNLPWAFFTNSLPRTPLSHMYSLSCTTTYS
jgi:hypothetical protein